jgi:hypothetical protein
VAAVLQLNASWVSAEPESFADLVVRRGRDNVLTYDDGISLRVQLINPAVSWLFQVQPGIRMFSELSDCRIDGALHVLVKSRVLVQETLSNCQASHQPYPPPSCPEAGPVQIPLEWAC